MSTTDPVKLILSRLSGIKETSTGWMAFCPAHEDRRERSLSIRRGDDGRALVHCFVGCQPEHIVAALGLSMSDLFPPRPEVIVRNGQGQRARGEGGISTPRNTTATLQHGGLTVTQYAEAKHLDPERLRSFGLSDITYCGKPAVRIPYRDEAGNEGPVRFRLCLAKSADGDDRFRWKTGSKLCLYGLDRLPLARERGYGVLPEGESDCHTLWTHGEPAFGVPGANTWNDARDAHYFDGIPTIYVVVEPDKGGETLVDKLSTSALADRVHLVSLAPHKDASALHCDDPERFAERWEAALAAAVPLSEQLDEAAQQETAAAWDVCQDLARESDIPTRAANTVAALGVAGERLAVMLVFLAMVSRLLSRPVSVAIKGPSSAGKSYLVEQTLRLFPDETFYALTAMSEKALAYSDEPLSHRMLVLYEAAGMSGDMASYLMRSLLSEGCVRYETVEKTKDGLRARLIERPGPTGLIVTTTATRLHPENETRMVSFTVADTKEQTRAIFHALANGRAEDTDLTPWHALQRWLGSGEHRVVVPFADALAQLVPPKAVRLRRDFGLLLTFIRAHALLHRASRTCNEDGEIVATLDDYESVRELLEPLIASGVEATVPETIRETVDAVKQLCPKDDDTVSLAALARQMRLDKGTVSRRASMAKERGYLVNHETKRGQPAKYALGEPLPEDTQILPDRCSVAAIFEGDHPPSPPPPGNEAYAANGHAPSADRWADAIRVRL
jgi:hypothetical protein